MLNLVAGAGGVRSRRLAVLSRLSLVLLLSVLGVSFVGAGAAVAKPRATRHHAKHHHRRHHRRRPHAQAYFGPLKNSRIPMFTVALGGRGGGGDPGDDYPASLKNRPMDSVFDQWREFNRECTSFVAWALASRNGFNMPFFANARDWGARALARGYAVNSTPAPGSVAWSTAGTYGHVAYVQDVSGGNVYIEEYNHNLRGTYSARTVPASTFTGYIHFADRPSPPPPAPNPTPPSSPTPPPSSPPPTSPPPTSPPPTSPPPPHAETTGGVTHTWTNYTNAGGTQGPSIASNTTVQIACKVTGFRVADGNTWWYRIASSPWNSAFYASADAFYNNGQTTGSLVGTPFVDPAVPDC